MQACPGRVWVLVLVVKRLHLVYGKRVSPIGSRARFATRPSGCLDRVFDPKSDHCSAVPQPAPSHWCAPRLQQTTARIIVSVGVCAWSPSARAAPDRALWPLVTCRAIEGTYLSWENEQLRQILAHDQPPPPLQGHSASYDAQGQPLWRGACLGAAAWAWVVHGVGGMV